MTITKSEFAAVIVRAVFAAMRNSAPLIPDATPEFIKKYLEVLSVSEQLFLSVYASSMVELTSREAGIELEN